MEYFNKEKSDIIRDVGHKILNEMLKNNFLYYTERKLGCCISSEGQVLMSDDKGRASWAAPWILGTTNRGPLNQPIFIRDSNHAREVFGDVKSKIRKIKRIFSENDPYGEENWEE